MKATFVAFDTETTGLEPESCEIIEIAGVKFQLEADGSPAVICSFSTLVGIDGSIPAAASAVNHIYDHMIKDAPPVSEALRQFFRWAGQSTILVAHNASFDVSFIGNAIYQHSLMLPKNPVFCTRRMACRLFPEMRHRLADLEAHLLFGNKHWMKHQDATGAHRALYDAKLCMSVFAEMLRRRVTPESWDVEKLIKILPGLGGERIRFDAPMNSHDLQQEYLNTKGGYNGG